MCLDIDNATKPRIMDEEARAIMKTVCKVKNAIDLQNLDVITRNAYLTELKEKYNVSIDKLKDLRVLIEGWF